MSWAPTDEQVEKAAREFVYVHRLNDGIAPPRALNPYIEKEAGR